MLVHFRQPHPLLAAELSGAALRVVLSSLGAMLGSLVVLPAAFAQQFPDRPVRLIVPFAPGGTTDILARTLGQSLGEHLGQQVISDNRPGASGNTGSALAAKSPPDGIDEIPKWAKAVKLAGVKID